MTQNPQPAPEPHGQAAPPSDAWTGARTLARYQMEAGRAPQVPVPHGTGHAPRQRRTWPAVVAASVLSATLAAGGTALALHGAAPEPATSPDAGRPAVMPASYSPDTAVQGVAAQVGATVVAIGVTTDQGGAEGSGVIISARGDVLTNHHVVEGARTLTVTLADGRIYDAEIVGTDPSTDLAVVRLTDPPADLAVAAFGSSDDLAVGEQVVAIGNPLGLSATVTSGIVSALDRPVVTGNPGERPVVTNAIQVDAAVNPGNSGGPLFDLSGSVVGITSSIATTSSASGSIGLGFAIPIDLASRVAEEIIQNGSASHAFLGVSLTDGEATADGGTRAGAKVMEVTGGSAAEAAGLRVGDVVVGIDGGTVTGADSLTGAVRSLVPGERVTLDVVRDGAAREVEVTLGSVA